MTAFDIYGFVDNDLEAAIEAVEAALGTAFQAHESSYHGGDYYRQGENDSEHFIMKRNLDLADNEPAEPDYAQYPILLYVNRTHRSAQLAEIVCQSRDGVVLLKHEDL